MRLKVVYTIYDRLSDGSYGSSSTHIARSVSGVSRPAAASDNNNNQDSEKTATTATTFLKSCLALICYTRPDLIPDANTDYSVSVLDIAESAAAGNAKIFEGQGMMGWILAEHNNGTTCIAGKLQNAASTTLQKDGNDASAAEEMLEVVLELKPRKPIPRKDFLSTLASSSSSSTVSTSAPPVKAVEAAPAINQTMTLPNGSTVDGTTMLAMLQTLFTAAAAAAPTQNTSGNGATPEAGEEDSPEGQAHSMMNALGASMPLLPGINLFNPAQAKLLQQQMQAQNFSTTNQAFPVAKVRGVKTAKQGALNLHSSRGSTSSNGHPDSESKANMGDFTFPGKHNQNTSGKHTSQQQKQASSSHRSNIVASSSAHPASEPMSHSHLPHPISQMQNHHQQSGPRMKYWKDGCLKCSKTYSVGWRVKQTRKKALDGTILQPNMLPEDGKIAKLCEECAQKLPSHKNKKKRKVIDSDDEIAQRQGAGSMQSLQSSAHRANLPNTSPLRRSPRRHVSSNLNRSSFLSAQPLTSPTGSGGRNTSVGPSGKRRKFTSALSAAALREENKTAEGLTPDEGSLLAEIPSFKHRINDQDNTTYNAEGDLSSAQQQQAKEVFGNTNAIGAASASNIPKPPFDDRPISHEDESFNFFLNASPGTIMRSFNIMSPKKNGTPTNNVLSSAGTLKAFPQIGLSPLQSKRLASEAQGTSAVFSPLGSSLSTPFRALLNPATVKGRERATSEQPPANHSRLMEELVIRDTADPGALQQQILQVPQKTGLKGAPQFLSSDDNLLGSTSNVQINLLPATADRRQGGKEPSAIANDNSCQLLSDSIMDDFNAFLLNSSNGLFSPTPFIPKADASGKPALAPLALPYDIVKQQSLSPLAVLSSEMDFDLSNLPPSSPPPLPGSNSATTTSQHLSSNSLANVQDFWSNFNVGFTQNNGNYLASSGKSNTNAGQLDDGQSPISISTTVTQGGTPQEMPVVHETAGQAENGREERNVANQVAARPSTARTVTTSTESPISMMETDSVQDPLFEYFSFVEDVGNGSANDFATHQRQSSASSVSSAFLERLKKSTAGQQIPTKSGGVVPRSSSSSSNMTMSWSDSTTISTSSSLASLPVTDLTARSKLLQKQKALEEAKRTNVPIDSAVLEDTIDALFDLSD